jgi:glycosyltransferase involved in cell wall biosynthesis
VLDASKALDLDPTTASVIRVFAMTVNVSVVVAVFNPGRHIEPLLDSLRRQTMPAEQFEAIFVDDGSTDGTPERLDAFAAEIPNVRVLRIPASGGPGRPRNVGIDAARGTYVQIVDNDDSLFPRALERLYAYAVEHSSDVVVGREVRNQRAATGRLFEENVPRAALGVHPLMSLLTPHKMFRRQFLADHGIRFLEGHRRLEDHPFVMEAYVKAKVISILSDVPCYLWTVRDDQSNAGLRAIDWPSWYGNLADAIGVVEQHVDDSALRERLLAVWYASKVLEKLGAGFAKRDEDDERKQWTAARAFMADHFDPAVATHVVGINTTRDHLLRRDLFDLARDLGESEIKLRVDHAIEAWDLDDDAIRLSVAAWFSYADGTPLRCDVRDGRAIYRAPVPLPDVPDEALDFTRDLEDVRLRVALRRRGRWVPHNLPTEAVPLPQEPDGSRRIGLKVLARIDPESANGGRALRRGEWTLDVNLTGCGWSGTRPLRAPRQQRRTTLLEPLLTRRITVPVATRDGRVSLDVNQARLRVLTSSIGRPVLTNGRLVVPLMHVRGRTGASIAAKVILDAVRSGERSVLPAVVRIGRNKRARLIAKVPDRRTLRPTTWQLALRMAGRRTPLPATLRTGPWWMSLRREADPSLG